jgi:hypothetical protein
VDVDVHMPKIGKTAVHWLLEGFFIVVSVGLGFGVAQYRESRANHELAARVLKSIQSEVEHNLAILTPYVPIHRAWMDALEKADVSRSTQSGLDVYFDTRPKLPGDAQSSFAFLRRSAWDAAVSGGTLRLIDFDLAAALSDIYVTQEIVTANVTRLVNGPFSSTATFDPASRKASARMLWLTMADIQSSEEILIELYRRHLPAIRAAANQAH